MKMRLDRRKIATAIYVKLEQSQFRCALTGWKITPNSFEIDHIIPVADGGTSKPDNLQCVHQLVNRAKGTMSNAQFIEMCKAVAEQAKRRELGID